MVVKTVPDAKSGEGVMKGIVRLDVSKMNGEEFSELCNKFIEHTDISEDVKEDLARLFLRQIFASHFTKTQESIYNYNFAIRYAIDPSYTHEDLVKEIKTRHSLTSALQHTNAVYHIVESEEIKERLAEVITLMKVFIADKELKA